MQSRPGDSLQHLSRGEAGYPFCWAGRCRSGSVAVSRLNIFDLLLPGPAHVSQDAGRVRQSGLPGVLPRLIRDIIAGMPWGEVELEPEVRDWLEGLDDQRWAQAMFHLDLLEERGVLLGEPYTRQLAGKLRELRFYCGGERIRISYWITSGRRIIALTVFAKTKMRETAEVARAATAMARCQQEAHTAEDEEG